MAQGRLQRRPEVRDFAVVVPVSPLIPPGQTVAVIGGRFTTVLKARAGTADPQRPISILNQELREQFKVQGGCALPRVRGEEPRETPALAANNRVPHTHPRRKNSIFARFLAAEELDFIGLTG